MATRGSIPTDLIIFSRATETWYLDAMYGIVWSHNGPPDAEDYAHVVKGRKAFAVNKHSKSAPKTAQKWANAVPLLRPKARSRLAMLFEDVGDGFEEVPNDPIKGLKIFNLEIRGEGGRAYKVVDEVGYVWDLREDVLIEAMITCGIKNGILGGEYIWGILGSQIRLVRVGSQLHADLNVSTGRGKLKKIGLRDLRVGGVYQTKSGDHGVFCGFVHSKAATRKKMLWVVVNSYDYKPGRQWNENGDGYTTLPERNHQEAFEASRSYSIRQSHSYVEHVADVTVPGDVVAQYRLEQIDRCLQNVQNNQSRSSTSRRYAWSTPYVQPTAAEIFKGSLEAVTLSPHGQDVVIDPRIEAHMT